MPSRPVPWQTKSSGACGVVRGQRQRGRRVLGDQAVDRAEILDAVGHPRPAGTGQLRHLAHLEAEDRRLVPEALELLGRGQQIRRAAAQRGEALRGQGDPHRRSLDRAQRRISRRRRAPAERIHSRNVALATREYTPG